MPPSSDDLSLKANALALRGRYKRALRLYEKAGNYRGVGQMYEKLNQIEPAIESYIRSGRFVRAAELLLSKGDHEQAARMFSKGGEYQRAGQAFLAVDMVGEAAKMFERAGDHAAAAELYEQSGRFVLAASLYEACGMRERAIEIYEENGRRELAAKLCAESGEHLRAAELYTQMEIHIEAARCYAEADMKEEAIEAYVKADAFHQAIELCEELGRFEQVAHFYERMNDTEHAVEYYAKAGRFAEAGRIYEDRHLYVEAAKLYLKDKSMLARAGDLFEHSFQFEAGWNYKTTAQVWDIALADEAGHVAVVMANADVLVLDNEGKFRFRFRVPMGVRSRSVAIKSDASCIAVGTEGRSIYTLDATNRLLWKRELAGEVRGLAFADEDRMLVAGCTDGSVRAFNEDGKDIWSFQTEFKVWHLVINEPERQIIAGSGDGHIYVLSYKGHIVWKDKADDWVSRLAVSPNGQYYAAVLGQNRVRMVDLADRTILWEKDHDAIVLDVEFWTNDYLVIGASGEMTMWDNMGRVVSRELSPDRVTRIHRSKRDEQTLYVGHFERGIRVVKVLDCSLLAARCYEEHGDFKAAARLYYEKNELTSAARLYRQANEHLKVAGIAERLGDDLLAGESYEAAGNFEKAGECFARAGQLERAIECYDKGNCKSKAGALLAEMGDSLRAATLKLEANDFVAAGDLFLEAGSSEDAISAYEKAGEIDQLGTDGAIKLGRLYLNANRLDEAIKLVQPLRADETHGADAARLLAESFTAKKQYGIAIDHYRDALEGVNEGTAEHLEVTYGLACALERASRYDEAIATFEKILLVDYYYRDVSGRIERIREIGSVFRSVSGGTAQPTKIAGKDSSSNATVPQQATRRYEVLRKLGEGGMGIVYEARDSKLDRVVAMKVLPSKFSGNDELKTRFLREARAVAALSHENVVAIYDIGEEWGESYIAMEFIDGQSLREILQKEKKLSLEDALSYSRQIVDGLAAAHRLDIVHRDIKPENVMIAKATRQVKLMDFGLARMDSATNLTQEGAVMGTWRYMAPEQLRGDRVGTAADVYAMGVMMFEMLAGRPPFADGDMAYHHMNSELPVLSETEPSVPAEVSNVVAKCLIKDPDARIGNAMELAQALAQVMAAKDLAQDPT